MRIAAVPMRISWDFCARTPLSGRHTGAWPDLEPRRANWQKPVDSTSAKAITEKPAVKDPDLRTEAVRPVGCQKGETEDRLVTAERLAEHAAMTSEIASKGFRQVMLDTQPRRNRLTSRFPRGAADDGERRCEAPLGEPPRQLRRALPTTPVNVSLG
jgi:hypothetical protein